MHLSRASGKRTGRQAGMAARSIGLIHPRCDRACGLLLGLFTGFFLACNDSASNTPTSPSSGAVKDTAAVDRSIRVLLVENIATAQIELEQAGFALIDAATATPLTTINDQTTVTIAFDDGDIVFPGLNLSYDHSLIELQPTDPGDWVMVRRGQAEEFHGPIRILGGTGNVGSIINVIDMEEYLVGVVAAELHRGFDAEALQAQAVAARTFAWHEKLTAKPTQFWDLASTEAAQVYRGIEAARDFPESAEAVRDTAGLVLTWDGIDTPQIIKTYYSSTCGGSTQPISEKPIPPLAGNVACDFCKDSPHYHWKPFTVSLSEATERLRARYQRFNDFGAIQRVETETTTEAGRLVTLRFFDASGDSITLPAETFRLIMDPSGRSFRSTFCEMKQDGEQLTFVEGRGFGHGIGMCQYGANGLAKSGKKAAQILRFYYPESTLTRAY